MTEKIFNLRKAIGIKSEKYASKLEIKKAWKEVKDGAQWSQNKGISKNLILRYSLSLFWLHLLYNGWIDSSQNRDSKCIRINFSLIPLFYDHWDPSLTCFHTFWFLTCLHTSHFRSLFPFLKLEIFSYDLVCLVFCGHIVGSMFELWCCSSLPPWHIHLTIVDMEMIMESKLCSW